LLREQATLGWPVVFLTSNLKIPTLQTFCYRLKHFTAEIYFFVKPMNQRKLCVYIACSLDEFIADKNAELVSSNAFETGLVQLHYVKI
jgi:hypothetical protein